MAKDLCYYADLRWPMTCATMRSSTSSPFCQRLLLQHHVGLVCGHRYDAVGSSPFWCGIGWWKGVAEQIVGSLGSEPLARAKQLFYRLPKAMCQAR